VHSPQEARAAAQSAAENDEVFVIGGSSVYELFLEEARRLYITWIDAEVTGDVEFPEVDWSAWRITRESAGIAETAGTAGATGQLPHRFVDYERKPR
jgi:dihydrofolate reductase